MRLLLFALVTVATAVQITSNNPAFPPREGCISASSNATGAAVVVQDCGSDDLEQDWTFNPLAGSSSPQPLTVLGDKCLDVTSGNNTDGTKLQIWTCIPGSTNQLWLSLTDHTFQWAGTNKCIDLTNGNVSNGNPLQVWTCDSNNSNQKWTVPSLPPPPPPTGSARLRASGGPPLPGVCLTGSSNNDGARVTLDICSQPPVPGNDTWVIPVPGTTGQISTYDGTKCLDLRDGNSTNGNLIQVWSCVAGDTNQVWKIDGVAGMRSISWVAPVPGPIKCADVKDGVFSPGIADIQIWDCDPSNRNQWWFPQ